MEGQIRLTVVDASVLINFLGLGRLDLLTRLHRQIVITPEVDREIIGNRPALDAAVATGQIKIVSPVLGEQDAETFARLVRRLGAADASCIVAAKVLGADLGADDETFIRLASAIVTEALLGTELLLMEAVKAGMITVEAGDVLLAQLLKIKYRPKVQSLGDLLEEHQE